MNLVSSVSSFYIRTKFTLKNRVTTVHLLQCKTNFSFIYAFEGEICGKLKSTHLDLFTLDYIRLHSSTFVWVRLVARLHTCTFVQTRLVTCLHSSTFVQSRLMTLYTRLHLPTLVYTRLHLSSDLSVLLEQIKQK